jgi:hypothetical protein
VTARSRVAFASGSAGLVGATLLLSGRFDGSVALTLLFAWGARVAVDASLVDAGPILAAGAVRRLAQQASFAPAWALVIAVGAVRAGSAGLADLRGVNGVAGLALARGDALSVAGAWCALVAGALAIASRASNGAETAAPGGAGGRVLAPVSLRRLDAGGALAQAGLLATLFFGPQISDATDVIWWVAGVAALAALAWEGRRIAIRHAAPIAMGLAAIGLALILIGGTP